jgi:hypothetical protein
VIYVLDKGLVTRSQTGNFILTKKGYEFLGIPPVPESSIEENNFPPKYVAYGDNDKSLKLVDISSAQQKKLKRNVSLAILFLVVLLIASLIWVYKFA